MIDTDFMDALPRPIGRTADRELLDWGHSCDGSVLLLLLRDASRQPAGQTRTAYPQYAA